MKALEKLINYKNVPDVVKKLLAQPGAREAILGLPHSRFLNQLCFYQESENIAEREKRTYVLIDNLLK